MEAVAKNEPCQTTEMRERTVFCTATGDRKSDWTLLKS